MYSLLPYNTFGIDVSAARFLVISYTVIVHLNLYQILVSSNLYNSHSPAFRRK